MITRDSAHTQNFDANGKMSSDKHMPFGYTALALLMGCGAFWGVLAAVIYQVR